MVFVDVVDDVYELFEMEESRFINFCQTGVGSDLLERHVAETQIAQEPGELLDIHLFRFIGINLVEHALYILMRRLSHLVAGALVVGLLVIILGNLVCIRLVDLAEFGLILVCFSLLHQSFEVSG